MQYMAIWTEGVLRSMFDEVPKEKEKEKEDKLLAKKSYGADSAVRMLAS